MRKEWLFSLGLTSMILAGCSNEYTPAPAPAQPAWTGPVVEIPGVQPKYEPLVPSANRDYQVNGVGYKVVTDASHFSQVGLATSYGSESAGNLTASGEKFDPNAYTAADPVLPIPSYARVTNLANGRRLVVRINDRGPFTPGRIIDLSAAAASRLNISDNTTVRVDAITVAPDGTLSGPGTVGTKVAIQSYDLPARPNLGGAPDMSSSASTAIPAQAPQDDSTAIPDQAPQGSSNVMPVSNSTLNSGSPSQGAPVENNGFLGAPQPLASGTLESETPATPAATQSPATESHTAQATAAPAQTALPARHSTAAAAASASRGHYVVQVAAVNNPKSAQQLQQKLSNEYGVSGHVQQVSDNIYRVQLGGYAERSQADALKQRLSAGNVNGFVTSTQ